MIADVVQFIPTCQLHPYAVKVVSVTFKPNWQNIHTIRNVEQWLRNRVRLRLCSVAPVVYDYAISCLREWLVCSCVLWTSNSIYKRIVLRRQNLLTTMYIFSH